MGSDMHPDVVALIEVLPGFGTDEEVDWPVLEAAWGTRFPADYKSFMAAYGSGCIADAIVVKNPSTPDQRLGGMTDETGNARITWEPNDAEPALPPRPEDLIAWGATCGADMLCWLTTDPDPDRWPVIVWGRHVWPQWTVLDCGMVEFLRRAAAGEFADDEVNPMSVELYDPEYGAKPLVFESQRDRNRARHRG